MKKAEKTKDLNVWRRAKAVLGYIDGGSQQNVHKDVHYLADLGIIDLKMTRKNGSKKESVEPQFNWDGFDVAV